MTGTAARGRIRRLLPQRVRTRLALLYAALFGATGLALVAVTYALVASSIAKPSTPSSTSSQSSQLAAECSQRGITDPALIARCKQAFSAGAHAGASSARSQTLHRLLLFSLLALVLLAAASALLGWIVAGRVLRPVRQLTDTARRASHHSPGQRLALTGPRDELRELADTFDDMLDRIDAGYASQRRFLDNASHELRTPLTGMRTTVEVTLNKPARTPAQLEAMARKIHRSVLDAESLVEAMLTLAASEHPTRRDDHLDLSTAAEDALHTSTARSLISQQNLTLETHLDPAPAAGHRLLLERLAANLIDNALRHNIEGGQVTVSTGLGANRWPYLHITNSGHIIGDDELDNLFEPFHRSPNGPGIGLGLAIAHAISNAHHAELTITNPDGGGMEARFTLPSRAAQLPPAPSMQSDPGTRERLGASQSQTMPPP